MACHVVMLLNAGTSFVAYGIGEFLKVKPCQVQKPGQETIISFLTTQIVIKIQHNLSEFDVPK